MYIPCCPLTEPNAAYLARQREAFWDGKPITRLPPQPPLSHPLPLPYLTHPFPPPHHYFISLANQLIIWTTSGIPPPDYPSGAGESAFRGRLTPDYIMSNIPLEAQRALGLAGYDSSAPGVAATERKMLGRANGILGFG